jgi:hypothetical protein
MGPRNAVAEPDVLTLGPSSTAHRPRRWQVVSLAIILVLALMAGGWWLWFKPAPDFTLDALEDVYSGMVRSDGLNDLYTIEQGNLPAAEPVTVTPAECAPLFETTVYNRFPDGAMDGVSTYWFGDPATVSLLTVRYPDRAAARRAYASVERAMEGCVRNPIRLKANGAAGQVTPAEAIDVPGADGHLGYTYSTGSRERYAFHVMRYANTITWQYRYESRSNSYSALPAVQLMTGLVMQMRAVQELL